jgi:hypothetical protein
VLVAGLLILLPALFCTGVVLTMKSEPPKKQEDMPKREKLPNP